MIVKKTVTQEVEMVEDVVCNKCGSSLRDPLTGNYYGVRSVFADGGYGSELGDCYFCFSLCQRCTLELMSAFKIKPEEFLTFKNG